MQQRGNFRRKRATGAYAAGMFVVSLIMAITLFDASSIGVAIAVALVGAAVATVLYGLGMWWFAGRRVER
jgi:O-antigen/teichoic acid export membrane protein